MKHKSADTISLSGLSSGSGTVLDIAILGITDDAVPDASWRSVDLANRILQSRHHFAGLTAVRNEDCAIREHIRRLSTEHIADVVLIVDETIEVAGDPPQDASADALRDTAPSEGMLLLDPRIGFIGIVKLGAMQSRPTPAKPH